MRFLRSVVITALVLLPNSACQDRPQLPKTAQAPRPVEARAGMVSSAHPIATRAGIEILAMRGNAFDATVAVAAALNVVEPMMSGVGGYGTILLHSAEEEKSWFLNSSAHIPQAVDSDVFRAPTPDFEANRRGPKAISTPANARAWEAMHQKYGSLDWERLFQPAIQTAREGFLIDQRTAGLIERA